MKLAVSFAILATFIVFSYSQSPDWKAVGAKIDDIVTAVFANSVKILDIAKEEAAEVERAVKPRLDSALKEAKKILELFFDGVRDKKLTGAESHAHAQRLKDIFTKTKDSLKEQLGTSHPICSAKIAHICDEVFKLIDQRSAELLKLFNP